MTEDTCRIEIGDHTLMLLARLTFNEECLTFEECINNLLERYGKHE